MPTLSYFVHKKVFDESLHSAPSHLRLHCTGEYFSYSLPDVGDSQGRCGRVVGSMDPNFFEIGGFWDILMFRWKIFGLLLSVRTWHPYSIGTTTPLGIPCWIAFKLKIKLYFTSLI